MNASFVGIPSGIASIPEKPFFIPRPTPSARDCAQYGTERRTKKLAVTIRYTHGRFITERDSRSQNPPARPCSSVRPRPKMKPGFTRRSEKSAISAGSRVIESATEISTTMMAPPARPRKIVVGTSSMPASAITTVNPLKKTARLAVAPDMPIASRLSRPRRRSSRYLDTMKSE